MANSIDSAKLSQLIQDATREIVSRTEAYSDKYPEVDEIDPNAKDVVYLQYNKKKVAVPKNEYEELKEQNNATKTTMQDALKKIIDEVVPADTDTKK